MAETPVESQQNLAPQIEELLDSQRKVRQQLGRIIVGQEAVIDQTMVSIYAGGHSLLTGMPGLAKTLLISSLAKTLGLSFKRIQFTPDLMPADITGTEIIAEDRTTGKRELQFVKGPIFCNLLLADEINRTPPKTQAALLEAMEEKRVTVGGKTFELEPPFFVMATQNPIELEGTYPLPEAQLDRFMLNIIIEYSTPDEEVSIVTQTTGVDVNELDQSITGEDIVRFQRVVRQIPAGEAVTKYAVSLVRATRPGDEAPDFVNNWVNYGASVRAAQFLILGSKVLALMKGRFNVACEDIQALARPVLRHRILTNFHAESENVTTDDITSKLIETVPEPKSGL